VLVEERRVMEGRKYKCHFCADNFVGTKIFTDHINTCHDGRKSFVCNICNEAFISNSELFRHKSSSHEKTIFHCIYNGCEREFSQKGNMMSHYKTVHLKAKDYKCPTCGALFGENGSLKRHIRGVHEGIHRYKCDFEECTKCFNTSYELRRHMETVHWAIKSYVCEYEGCGKRFGQKCHLTKHEETHSEDNKYKCIFDCPYTTNFNSVLVRHLKQDHKIEAMIDRTYVCEYEGCGKKFGRQRQVTTHIDTVHLELDKSFACEYEGCGKKFGQKGNLTRHIDTVHLATNNKSDLVKHVKKEYTMEELINRRYPCEYEGCGQRFLQKGHLTRHVDTVHLEVKSFVCNHEGCGKRFGQKGHLTIHEAIHLEEKKYKCPYFECSYATSDRSTFIRHTKNKHTIEEVIDRACDSLLLPFVCEEEGCIERFATEEECSFHTETLH